ncbi:tetratricopeptide repeat protein [Clostridium sp. JNZ J1-5]
MGFFDSIRKMVLGKSSNEEDIINNSNPGNLNSTELGLLTKAVNFTLDNYQKTIQKVSGKITSTEYENDFYNNSFNLKKICDIEIDISELQDKIMYCYEKNQEIKHTICSITEEISLREQELEKLSNEEKVIRGKINIGGFEKEQQEELEEDLANVNLQIQELQDEIVQLKVKIDISNMDIKSNEEAISDYRHKIEKNKNKKLCYMTLSYDLDECVNFLSDIEEKDEFAKYCFQGLLDAKAGNEQDAIDNFDRYFSMGEELLENYYVYRVYAYLLIKDKRYDESKKYATAAVKHRPEDINIHKILAEAHAGLNEREEMELENTIVTMLEE